MAETKKQALQLFALGFVFSTIAFVTNAAVAPGPRVAQMMALGIVGGLTIQVLACAMLAKAKGRPWYFGALGLLSLVGAAILWFGVADAPTTSAPR